MKSKIVTIVALCSVVACSHNVMAPPILAEIENAPSLIVVDGVELTLETFLYRDFQPASEPDGRTLIATLRVKPAIDKELPAGLWAEAMHVVFGDEVWTPRLIEQLPDDRPPVLEFVARDGPKWDPGATVDVVLRLRRGGRELLLKAADQAIQRTD